MFTHLGEGNKHTEGEGSRDETGTPGRHVEDPHPFGMRQGRGTGQGHLMVRDRTCRREDREEDIVDKKERERDKHMTRVSQGLREKTTEVSEIHRSSAGYSHLGQHRLYCKK